jgi:hypothetical protein
MSQEKNIPILIFIVPYRDREEDKKQFIEKMGNLLDGLEKKMYEIYFIHQCDNKSFNRGAMKNAGFIFVKEKYPDCYKEITLCFNDVDTFPIQKGLINDYTTISGIVKHFYGYTFALGGIVSINCGDFEFINGYPNYYAWGFDDNMLQQRVLKSKIMIDRSTFYDISDRRIMQIPGSPMRVVNKGEFSRYLKNEPEGINTISNLSYTEDRECMVNINSFETNYFYDKDLDSTYNSNSNTPPFTVGRSGRKRCSISMII